MVRGQDPVRCRLRRQVRQQVTKTASRTKYPTVPSYLGGHTVIGPGSGWFSRVKPKSKKTKQHREGAIRRQKEARAAAAARRASKREANRIAATQIAVEKQRSKEAREADPVYQAHRAEERARQRARAEASRKRIEARMVSIVIERKSRHRADVDATTQSRAPTVAHPPLAQSGGRRSLNRPSRKRVKLAMTRSDEPHFEFGSVTRNILLDRLAPHVRVYGRGGGPLTVARLLNDAHIRTACGGLWTERLVKLLFGLLAERSER